MENQRVLQESKWIINTVIKAKNVIYACNFINAAEKLLPAFFLKNINSLEKDFNIGGKMN